MAEIIMTEEGSTPSTPSSGKWKAYFKADGLYVLDDAGLEIGPMGPLSDYIITPSVASNNLTLAIKNIAAADPSSSRPLVFRVGNTIYTLAASASFTKNAGTNWMNLGAAEFAALPHDLFVYAIGETGASAGLKFGYSRIPYARTMGDFVNTTTNEKYIAGNWTNFNSSDPVQNIGRFRAQLSAGAGYTWSIPSAVVINRPFFESDWLAWVPQFTNLSIGNGTLTARYRITGQRAQYLWAFIFGNSGSAISGSVSHTLPFTRESAFSSLVVPAGVARLSDTGTGVFAGVSNFNGATSANIVAQGAGATYLTQNVLSSTVPHTWASTDEIQTSLIEFPIA